MFLSLVCVVAVINGLFQGYEPRPQGVTQCIFGPLRKGSPHQLLTFQPRPNACALGPYAPSSKQRPFITLANYSVGLRKGAMGITILPLLLPLLWPSLLRIALLTAAAGPLPSYCPTKANPTDIIIGITAPFVRLTEKSVSQGAR